MKHSLLKFSMLGVACLVAGSANAAIDMTSTKELKSAYEYVQACGVEQVTALVEKMCPEVAARYGHENLVALFDAISKNDDSDGVISRAMSDDDMSVLTTQVLPLYQYVMKDRKEPERFDLTGFTVEVAFKAPVDECYYGLGDPRNTYDPKGIDCEACKADGGRLKTNGSYAWGTVSVGNKLYVGSLNNTLCGASVGLLLNPSLGAGKPFETSCWACEYQNGPAKDIHPQLGDAIPPCIFEYDTETGVVKDLTPAIEETYALQGYRSAGAHDGIVFLGGPTLEGSGLTGGSGSVFIAYDTNSGEFLGTSDMSEISGCQVTNIRKWLTVNGVLYAGLQVTTPEGVSKGAIARWYGDKNDPFNFQIVGWTGNQAAELVEMNNRIYVAGWVTDDYPQPCIYESPIIPEGGFVPESATEWEIKWNFFTSYDNNGGASFGQLFTYKGQLYWSTMTTPYMALIGAIQRYGALTNPRSIAYVLGSIRATTLWRSDFKEGSEVEMLYGEDELPFFEDGTWALKDNLGGYKAKFGASGYGNLSTNYTWAAAEYGDRVYIGTMDMGGLALVAKESIDLSALESEEGGEMVKGAVNSFLDFLADDPGYEMLVIEDPAKPAMMVTSNGFDAPSAYGLRNLNVVNGKMYVGTASPFNIKEDGGWREVAFTDPKVGIEAPKADSLTPGFIYSYANGYITLKSYEGDAITSVEMFDAAGKAVYADAPEAYETFIVTTDLTPGVYVVKASTASLTRSFKVAVK